MRRAAPRPLTPALDALLGGLAPASTLARVQEVWERVAGSTIAAAAQPVAEHEGSVTVLCEASVWAQELELLAGEIVPRLNAELGGEVVRRLRCRTA